MALLEHIEVVAVGAREQKVSYEGRYVGSVTATAVPGEFDVIDAAGVEYTLQGFSSLYEAALGLVMSMWPQEEACS